MKQSITIHQLKELKGKKLKCLGSDVELDLELGAAERKVQKS